MEDMWSTVVEIMEPFECKGRGNEENGFLRKTLGKADLKPRSAGIQWVFGTVNVI